MNYIVKFNDEIERDKITNYIRSKFGTQIITSMTNGFIRFFEELPNSYYVGHKTEIDSYEVGESNIKNSVIIEKVYEFKEWQDIYRSELSNNSIENRNIAINNLSQEQVENIQNWIKQYRNISFKECNHIRFNLSNIKNGGSYWGSRTLTPYHLGELYENGPIQKLLTYSEWEKEYLDKTVSSQNNVNDDNIAVNDLTSDQYTEIRNWLLVKGCKNPPNVRGNSIRFNLSKLDSPIYFGDKSRIYKVGEQIGTKVIIHRVITYEEWKKEFFNLNINVKTSNNESAIVSRSSRKIRQGEEIGRTPICGRAQKTTIGKSHLSKQAIRS